MRAWLLLGTIVAGCNLVGSVDSGSGSTPEGGADAEVADTAPSEGGDVAEAIDAEQRGGSVAHVVSAVEILVERLCDLDGDGIDDSAVAELGPTHAELLAGALSVAFQGRVADGDSFFLFYFPWIDDVVAPSDPETRVIVARGEDTDDPPDPTDSFSGEEPVYVSPASVDGCGEPLHAFEGIRIADGEASMSLESTLEIPNAGWNAFVQQARGTMEPYGVVGQFELCTYATIRELGSAGGIEEGDGLTMLEILTAGGAAVGVPSLPGINPDVDLDGDGLERVLLDDDGHVRACVDGDDTEIVDADCWQDARIADAVSFNLRMDAVSAVFSGLRPGWRGAVAGTCEEPPEQSLWDPP